MGGRGRLDADRLRGAVVAVCGRHPLAAIRQQAGWLPTDRRYTWEIPDELDVDPLQVADVPDEPALDELRTRLYSPPIDLEASPPLRVALAREPERDLVLLNTSHVPLDGVGTVRVAQAIARAYRGLDEPPDPVPLEQARDLRDLLAPSDLGKRLARSMDNALRALAAIEGPARIARVGAGDRDGFGFVQRRVSAEQIEVLLDERPAGATFNDVLLAALHLTIDRWNAEHDESGDRISVTMPVNARPREWYWDMPGMYAILLSVSTTRGDRSDLSGTTAAIAAQTSRLKRDGRFAGPFDVLRLAEGMTLGVKRALPLLIPLTGERFADSAVLSNLGRIPEPPSFDEPGGEAESPRELWFSPPCGMPIGVGVGAATVDGVLRVTVRHRFAQFDRSAAADFADLFLKQLGAQPKVNA